MPPGEYLAIAVEATTTVRAGDQWQDPDYLETLVAAARRITLPEEASVLADSSHSRRTLRNTNAAHRARALRRSLSFLRHAGAVIATA
jgi:hypothetical protein